MIKETKINMFNLDLYIFIAIGLSVFLLGLLVFLRNYREKTNQAFGLFCLNLLMWMISNYAETFVKNLSLASFFLQLDFALASFLAFTLSLFCYQFTKSKLPRNIVLYLIPTIIFSVLPFSDLIVREISFNKVGGLIFNFGPAYWLYAGYILLYSGAGFIKLIHNGIYSKGQERARNILVLFGILLSSFFMIVINLFLQNFIAVRVFHTGLFGMIFVVGFMTYAIIKHQLMDIRLILRSSIVYVLSLITIILPAVIMRIILGEALTVAGWIDLAVVIFAIAVFPRVKTYYYKIANKYFFSSLYDSREVIAGLSEKMRETLEIDKIYSSISDILTQSFHCKAIGILKRIPGSGNYKVIYNKGFEVGDKNRFMGDERLHKKYVTKNKAIVVPELKRNGYRKYKKTIDVLEKFGVAVLVPLNVKGKTIGLIALGRKESGDAYNQEDLQVLSIVSAQSAIAIENALLYEQTREFTRTLQGKVDAATKELRKKNVELQKLDKMKSEFVSVASHQLRTPLTAIKWGLEIILEDKKNKLTKKQKKYLLDIVNSNDRLIRLVNELLNISRIDDGRLKIEPVPTDVCALVKSVLKEYQPIIRHKNLRLIEKCDNIPKIRLDPNVITKAFSNFISNAIKYNRDGKRLHVLIKKQDKDNILITFRDEGIGIPESEQKNIFKKFYRASNAATSNTEGTGLGLYIAKSAIEQSGGRVWFESHAGEGTTFFVTLPLKGSRAVKGERTLS